MRIMPNAGRYQQYSILISRARELLLLVNFGVLENSWDNSSF
jgi:hypothetical protein